MQHANNFIDTTNNHALEPVQTDPTRSAGSAPPADPATKVVIALANELQMVYAHDQQKLSAANSALRKAIRK